MTPSGTPPGTPAAAHLVVPGAGGEDVGRLQRGGGQGPPSGLADLLRHEAGAHLLHGRPAARSRRAAPHWLPGR